MTIDLTGRRIILTGAATGIGAETASYFLANGATLVALDIQDQAGDENPRVLRLKCDITDREAVTASFDKAQNFMGGLDALCHIAGLNGRGKAEELTAADMRKMFEVNVMGTFNTNQEAWRLMHDAGGGSITNVTSAAAIRGQKDEAHYSASKGAVAAWTRAVAHDWGKFNIRVNSIAPMARTPMVDVARNFLPEEQWPVFDARLAAMGLLPGGLRRGDAIAPLLAFLASQGSDYITGQSFSADGGVMMLGS
jgi:NAD(P)-dependent dehydrogenase (short-subunit alcohol dehydrogenase family)